MEAQAASTDSRDVGGEPRTSGKPFYAKRSHKKSRAGCANCKKRKVKCDEARPRCRACTVRNEACMYPSGPQSRNPSDDTVVSSTLARDAGNCVQDGPSTPSRSATALTVSRNSRSRTLQLAPFMQSAIAAHEFRLLGEPLFRPVQIDETDMQLLWFYTAKGFNALSPEGSRDTKVNEILQITIPRHAFTSPFLMVCLLALAALELQAYGQPIDIMRVLTYRSRAFSGYRKAVEEAKPETFPALLACSLLLCALSSQMFRDEDSPPLCIIDWMVIWRGIGLIVQVIKPQRLYESGMAMLFARPCINLDASTRSIPNHLLFMISSISSDDSEYPDVKAYYETLKYLGSLYRELEDGIGRNLNLRTITWFTFLPKGFIELARSRRPRALVIIAHYLVFVKLCKHIWWARGIADKEIRDIDNLLGAEWRSWLAAPLAALATDDDVELGKILLNNKSWTPEMKYCEMETLNYVFVDDTGRALEYDGRWVRTGTHTPPIWNIHDHSQRKLIPAHPKATRVPLPPGTTS